MAKKTLYFDYFCGYNISAVTENGKIIDFNFERHSDACAVGNIYKARVERVLPGMNAAFVNCGLKKNCYLSFSETLDEDKYRYDKTAPQPEPAALKEGDELPVQIIQLPTGRKGAKVSCRLTFVGKCLIYMPDSPFIGVSRKITDAELKKNLVFSAKRLLKEGSAEGIVLRTASPYAKQSQLKEELSYLRNLYNGILADLPSAGVGDLVYTDFALPIRVLRDTLSYDIDSIIVGSERLKGLINNIVNLYPPRTRRPVILHDTGRDMMNDLGLDQQILDAIYPRVQLENGAYLVIERTEALTVIDVNTGKFVGDDNLEQTVYCTNLLAAREIARQVRLRNIGGIVVVDFIDMQSGAHRAALVEELERALKNDRAKCSVSPMSRLGLVEFTRKRTGDSPLACMFAPCKECGGTGRTFAPEAVIIGLRVKLLNMFADGVENVRVDMNNEVLSRLLGWKEMRAELNGRTKGKIYAVPHRTYSPDKLVIKPFPFNIPYDAVEI